MLKLSITLRNSFPLPVRRPTTARTCWVLERLGHTENDKKAKRVVLDSFELALNGRKRQDSPTQPKLDGVVEAKLIAIRLGKPPAGFGRWTLQLLADEMVALEVVDSICPETVRQTLKKQDDKAEYRVLGDPAGAGRGIYCVYRRGVRNLRNCLRFSASCAVHG